MRYASCLCVALPVLFALAPVPAAAQAARAAADPVLTIFVRGPEGPLAGATVRSERRAIRSDDRGIVRLALPPGPHELLVERPGFGTALLEIQLADADSSIVVTLEEAIVYGDVILVSTTRRDRRIEEEPTRVDVLTREEIEEKMLMRPGGIAMLLDETGGVRVQPAAPTLGGAQVRVHGLPGRYTLLLADGLPLYGAAPGSLGPLQIPPMDLAQVEVVKGAASALYGGEALGGVVNLITRRPEGESELLINRTSREGTDIVFWTSNSPRAMLGYTLLASAHAQQEADISGDGWFDVPRVRRAVVRPRFFFAHPRASAMLTGGATAETRRGGGVVPAAHPAYDAETRRVDTGGTARLFLGTRTAIDVRGSVMSAARDRGYAQRREHEDVRTAFAELSARSGTGPLNWLMGAAWQSDVMRVRDLEGFDHSHEVSAAFAQVDFATGAIRTSTSGRIDFHNVYGEFFSPRAAVLLTPVAGFTLRATAGSGFHAPTALLPEIEEIGLGRLAPLTALAAERARTASIDAAIHVDGVEFTATLFGGSVRNALQTRPTGAGQLEILNLGGDVRTRGAELFGRYRHEPFHLTATYTRLGATQPTPEGDERRDVPLTPRHTASFVGMWEDEDVGRVGIEVYYIGPQALDDDPYRSRSRPYALFGILLEHGFGPVRGFLNFENLTDVRQTRFGPLLRPEPSPAGRWTTDVWAPLDGRVINGGFRVRF
jgi:outer membrane receptor for ferrienterochelin and colicins